MRYLFSGLLFVALLMSNCSLRRENPLDPLANPDLVVPATVAGVTCTPSPPGAANKFVEVRWTANSPLNSDGYYIYRGLAYNSEYAVVDTVFSAGNNICNHGSKPWHNIFPGLYWYKVSAFKDVYDDQNEFIGRLEGRKSEARPVTVPS